MVKTREKGDTLTRFVRELRVANDSLRLWQIGVLRSVLCLSVMLGFVVVASAEVYVGFRFEGMFGEIGGGEGQFLEPEGLAVDMSGNLFVVDTGNNRVQKLAADGTFLLEVGGSGWEDGQFDKPGGIATGKGLEVYVADSRNRRIQVFNLNLRLLSVIGGRDVDSPIDLGTLGGIAVSDVDEVLVTDIDADQLVQIDTYSRIDRSFGGFGYGAGNLRRPLGVAIEGRKAVYVCDSENDRIAVFDRFGNFQKAIGEDVLMQPSAACLGPERTLIVADTGHHRIVVFDLNADEVVSHLGGPDPGKGPMAFQWPRGVALGRAGALFVLDSGNGRIQKLQLRVSRR